MQRTRQHAKAGALALGAAAVGLVLGPTWMELNGPRLASTSHDQLGGKLDFSGAWMGMDGWTLRKPT